MSTGTRKANGSRPAARSSQRTAAVLRSFRAPLRFPPTPADIAAVAAAAEAFRERYEAERRREGQRPRKATDASCIPPTLKVIAAVAGAATAYCEWYKAAATGALTPPGTPAAPLPGMDMVAAEMARKLGYRPSGPLDQLDDILMEERLRLMDADSLLAALVATLQADESLRAGEHEDDNKAQPLPAGNPARVAVYVRRLLNQTLNNLDAPHLPLYAMRRDALKRPRPPETPAPPETSDIDSRLPSGGV
jgi:hypothetical protein